MVKRMRLFGEGADMQFMTISNCHTVSVPWSTIVAESETATPNTTASIGTFTKVSVTSQRFSGHEGQCGLAK